MPIVAMVKSRHDPVHTEEETMGKYLFAYHGGAAPDTESPDEVQRIMGLWNAWYGELGDAIVDGGAPIMVARTVQADGSVTDGGGANPLTGYTIVTAESLDAAAAMASGCPIRESGGSIEVAELIDMG